jgi:signal transduction histidine kinase
MLAREEAGPPEQSCDAGQIVSDAVARHQSLAEARATAVSFAATEAVELDVPAAMFAIVVANLLHNALAHTDHGQVVIGLDRRRLEVSDTGIGIRAEEMAQVFERFHRGPASTGSGIGLSLVKRICERYSWRISLDSRPGGGTTATLLFRA